MQQANALTVDVEDYFHVAALSDSIARADWASRPSRVVGSTRRLLDIFDAAGARATFFVLGWVADRFPDLVKEIHRRGHEVASHGQSHRLVYDQSPAEFRHETECSKATLEALVGEAVIGYRAASYSIVARSLWALDVIAEAGYRYDSSIVPARHDLYGMPGAEVFPHKLTTPQGAMLVEFPPSTYAVLGVRVPVGGGGYFRFYPYWVSRHLLRKINGRFERPFIFYVHPWEVDPEQPRVRASWRSRFRHYVNLGKTDARLNRLVRDFRFRTARDVLRDVGLLA